MSGQYTKWPTVSTSNLPIADATQTGLLSAVDWNIFNNKLDASRFNDITGGNNGTFEVDTIGWDLYNDQGRADPATLVNQDLTYTSALSGSGGNGVNIEYVYNAGFPSSAPNINVISSTHVQVQWSNGPTVANNPTATQLKAAWDAVPAAVAIATVAITGTSSKLQYIVGSMFLSGGGDSSPVDGTGGVVAGVTFTRNTATPLSGVASGDLGKDAVNRQGEGVSTDFTIDSADRGQTLQIDFLYEGSAGMVLGSSSDVQVFIYDITNAALIPVTPLHTITGPVSTIKTFTGVFVASASSVNYRLILHTATTNASAWDLLLDNVVINDIVTPGTATQVPSVVLLDQPISGAVTDHMAVAWIDGASAWVPATSAFNGDYWCALGFATDIVGLTASVYVHGYMDGFSFGPFSGYNQYIDPAIPGGLTPLPSPFTDKYVIAGKAISATALNIQFFKGLDLIVNGSGTPIKGGLLSNSGVNDGTGDQALAVGANGNVLVANSAQTLGLQWAPAVVAAAPFTYTLATRTLTIATATNAVAGVLSAADHTTYSGYAATIALKANIASPTFTGVPAAPTAAALTNTTQIATTAFVTTAGNLKANLAAPTFTGDVNSSTGNVLISTIGKGLQVKTGANAKIGQSVLVGGTVTVANTSVTANSRIFLSVSTAGGTQGFLSYVKVNGTSFTVTSSSVLDTSTIDWNIIESIP